MTFVRQPWDAWYKTRRWQLKARRQITRDPLCKFCLEQGVVVAAQIADHVIPHKGDKHLFWDGELQSLCASCHSSRKAAIERHGKWRGYDTEIGIDGYPVDKKRHPFFQK